jgi:hypothetical protein
MQSVRVLLYKVRMVKSTFQSTSFEKLSKNVQRTSVPCAVKVQGVLEKCLCQDWLLDCVDTKAIEKLPRAILVNSISSILSSKGWYKMNSSHDGNSSSQFQKSSNVQEIMRNHRKHTDRLHKTNHVHEVSSNHNLQRIQFSKFSMQTCTSMVIQSPWSVKCRLHKFQYPKQASLHSIHASIHASLAQYHSKCIQFMQMRFLATTFPLSSWIMSMKFLSHHIQPSLCRIDTMIARAQEYIHSCQSNPIST